MLRLNNYGRRLAGTVLRVLVCISYFLILIVTSIGKEAGNPLACVLAILLFSLFMLMERVPRVAIVSFVLLVFGLSVQVWPAILNQCHISLWYLIIGAFRNCFLVESHATMAWTFSALGGVYTSALGR